MKKKLVFFMALMVIGLFSACSSVGTGNESEVFNSGEYDFTGTWRCEGALIQDENNQEDSSIYTIGELNDLGYYPQVELKLDDKGHFTADWQSDKDNDVFHSEGTYTVEDDVYISLHDEDLDVDIAEVNYEEKSGKLLFGVIDTKTGKTYKAAMYILAKGSDGEEPTNLLEEDCDLKGKWEVKEIYLDNEAERQNLKDVETKDYKPYVKLWIDTKKKGHYNIDFHENRATESNGAVYKAHGTYSVNREGTIDLTDELYFVGIFANIEYHKDLDEIWMKLISNKTKEFDEGKTYVLKRV